jgi:hypothetical protein
MTRHHSTSESLKSIAGGILVGLGLHTLCGNLNGDAAQLRHLLGIPAGEALGVLSSGVLAASQAARAYGLDHQELSKTLLPMLISFWPLLLVIVGTILLQNALTDKVIALPASKKYFQNNQSGCRFRCPSFDV